MYIGRKKMNRNGFVGLAFMSVLVIIVLSATVLQAGITSPVDDQYGTIMGTVSDSETGEPIQGALVILTYHDVIRNTLTDEKGYYCFNQVPNCFCLKNVSAHKEGYISQYKMVAVQEITIVDFQLEPEEGDGEPTGGTITGIVTDAVTGLPIPDALMTLKYHEVVRMQYTDSDGYYIFTDVPLCFCLKNVSAEKKGYESQYKMVAVQEMTYVNFSLEPVGSGETDQDAPVGNANDFEAITGPEAVTIGIAGIAIALVSVLLWMIVLLSKRVWQG